MFWCVIGVFWGVICVFFRRFGVFLYSSLMTTLCLFSAASGNGTATNDTVTSAAPAAATNDSTVTPGNTSTCTIT